MPPQGSREYTAQQIGEQLGLARMGRMRNQPAAPQAGFSGGNRFILPLSECDFFLTGLLQQHLLLMVSQLLCHLTAPVLLSS